SDVFTDYHYYGTGDVGGSPDEDSVKRLEAIVTKGTASFPPEGEASFFRRQSHPQWPEVKVGDGPVHVISATADQMFLDITPSEAKGLPRYAGEMELTNHSAGSLTSQAYQKRWLRKEELLADAAEKASIAAEWLGARTYPRERLYHAWTLVMGGHFHDIAAGTATPKSYEFAWNDDVIAMNQFAGVLTNATEGVAAALNTEVKGVPVVVFNSLENQYYRVRLNGDGDVASIFDKTIGKELLSAPARLAISYDNPQQWPAWNMDWDQERTPPKAYVSGPPKIRVAENGPARVALE